MWPHKFHNMTNGITPRRWLLLCNPGWAEAITQAIGDAWITNLSELHKLRPLVNDADLMRAFSHAKQENKNKLATYLEKQHGMRLSTDAIFDCQVKRIHEYKRQLLNALFIATQYVRILAYPQGDFVPRVCLIGGKAAPGYAMAKLIIKLITSIADIVNADPVIGDRLKVVFVENYRVSLAEKIIPAADLSEQISTAGTEASGTSNMKFMLNGALTIGTMDGANVEICDEVGRENMFIFGLTHDRVNALRPRYNPRQFYESDTELRQVLDMIAGGAFCTGDTPKDHFQPLIDSLLVHGDRFFLLADYRSYIDTQDEVSAMFRDRKRWVQTCILNVAAAGKFSADRTISEYASRIWDCGPVAGVAQTQNTTSSIAL